MSCVLTMSPASTGTLTSSRSSLTRLPSRSLMSHSKQKAFFPTAASSHYIHSFYNCNLLSNLYYFFLTPLLCYHFSCSNKANFVICQSLSFIIFVNLFVYQLSFKCHNLQCTMLLFFKKKIQLLLLLLWLTLIRKLIKKVFV